jgi:general secretion pathway protein F/type IV pilus assembly protein PilC
MIFIYKGIDKNGKKIKGKLEASSYEEAKKKLIVQGILYKTIKEEFGYFGLNFKKRYKINPKDLSTLSRELSLYLKSGITIVNAVKIISSQYKNDKKISLFLTTINSLLDEGKTFYQALEEQKIIYLPQFYKQSIKVSEKSGILDEVLLELARFLKEQDRINRQIQSSLAYPIFILVVSFFMVGFMLSFVVPKITSIFSQMHQKLPLITRIVISSGDFLQKYGFYVLLFLAIFTILWILAMKFNRSFRYAVHLVMLKIPFFGKLIETTELARFAYMTSLLLKSGIPIVQVINLSSNILKNSVIKDSFLKASSLVVEGKKLSQALAGIPHPPNESFIQAVALGEETGEVQKVMQNLSELYFEENNDKITILLSLLEPVMMLIVGGIIGFIVAAMLLPIFSMNVGI